MTPPKGQQSYNHHFSGALFYAGCPDFRTIYSRVRCCMQSFFPYETLCAGVSVFLSFKKNLRSSLIFLLSRTAQALSYFSPFKLTICSYICKNPHNNVVSVRIKISVLAPDCFVRFHYGAIVISFFTPVKFRVFHKTKPSQIKMDAAVRPLLHPTGKDKTVPPFTQPVSVRSHPDGRGRWKRIIAPAGGVLLHGYCGRHYGCGPDEARSMDK